MLKILQLKEVQKSTAQKAMKFLPLAFYSAPFALSYSHFSFISSHRVHTSLTMKDVIYIWHFARISATLLKLHNGGINKGTTRVETWDLSLKENKVSREVDVLEKNFSWTQGKGLTVNN